MGIERLNLGLLDRKLVGKKIEETGARFISLGDGFYSSLDEILRKTLLGIKLNRPDVEIDLLSAHEKAIIKKEYSILTITDLDGILTNPLKAVFDADQRRISLAAFRFLRKICSASHSVWLLTSRVNPDKIRENFPFLREIINLFQKKAIDDFPFWDSSSTSKLEKFGNLFKGKNNGIAVLTEKSFSIEERKNQLQKLIEHFFKQNNTNIVIYIIGSNFFDRRAVLKLCQENNDLASKIVYIDTGHLIL